MQPSGRPLVKSLAFTVQSQKGDPVRRATPLMRTIPILVVMFAAAVAGMAWAISSPVGSSPDEDYHLASIWCPPPVENSGCHLQKDANGIVTVTVTARVAVAYCYAHYPDRSGACIWAVPADKLYNDPAYDRGGYPPGFYNVLHILAHGDPFTTVYVIRGFNVALAIVLGALLVAAGTRPTRRILAYTVAGTFVPLGMFIVPSVNPSSWSLIGVTTAAFALHSYWLAERRGLVIVNAVLAAVGVFLAAGSRADAALYSILAAVAVTCLHYRSVRRHPVRLVLPGAIVVGGGIAFRMASQAGSALAGGLGAPEPTGGWHLLLSNIINLPILIFGSGGIPGLGSLGQLDTPMPPIVWVSTLMVLAFLVMAGLQRLSWMKVLVTTAGILVVAAIPLYILQTSHLIVGEGVQPRYVLPLLPVVALVLLTGSRPDHAVRLTVASSWVAWALLSVANSVALLFNIQRYTTGVLGPLFPGHTVAWWSTSRMPPLPTWILGSLGFAIAAWMIVRLSMGSDAPIPPAVVAGQGQEALEPSPPSADVSVLASAPAVADTQTTPTEPATTDSTLVEPATEDPVAAPATPQWTSGPASR